LFILLINLVTIQSLVQYNSVQEAIAQNNITNSQKNIQDNKLSLYENCTYGIKATYPSTWEKVKGSSSDNIVIFRTKANISSGRSNAVIGIYVHDLPYRKIPFQEYNNIHLESLNKLFNLSNSRPTNLSNSQAHEAVYTNSSKGITALQIWTTRYDHVYTVVYLANSKQYANYLPDANYVINSLEIVEPRTMQFFNHQLHLLDSRC
jgi:PsbP-like protein